MSDKTQEEFLKLQENYYTFRDSIGKYCVLESRKGEILENEKYDFQAFVALEDAIDNARSLWAERFLSTLTEWASYDYEVEVSDFVIPGEEFTTYYRIYCDNGTWREEHTE